MTHDELLAAVQFNKQTLESSDRNSEALRAVVELHKPVKFGLIPSRFICGGCDNRCGCYEGDMGNLNDWFTCPTIQAIQEQLK